MKSEISNFQNILSEIEDYAILLLDTDGTVKDWNKGAQKLKGYTAEEIIGKNFRIFYTEEDRNQNLPEKLLAKAIAEGKALDEGWRLRKDGSTFWGSILITTLYDENRTVIGFLKITRDLSERKRLEEKSFRELSDYKFALDESAIVAITDQKGIIKHVNNNFCRISKYTEDELRGQDHRIINSGHHSKEFIRDLWSTIAHGQIWKGELKNKAKDGTYYWVDTTIVPFLTEAGKPYQYLAIRFDITGRKKGEEELTKANRLYAFISAINQSIVHLTDEQVILDNACDVAVAIGKFKMVRITRQDEQSSVLKLVSIGGTDNATSDKLKYAETDHKDPRFRVTPAGKALRTGHYAVSNSVLKDPDMVTWRKELAQSNIRSIISFPLKKFNKVTGIFSFYSEIEDFFDDTEIGLLEEAALDISFALENFEKEKQRKSAEEHIARNDMQLNVAQAIAKMGSWEVNMIDSSQVWSEELYRVFGIEKQHPSTELFLSFIHPEDLPGVSVMIAEAYRTLKNSSFSYRFIRKDGEIRHGFSEWKFEFDKQGKPIRRYGIVQDITERKKVEEEIQQLNETLEQRVKERTAELTEVNKALESFSYSVSHDLRAPVRGILGFAKIIQKEYGPQFNNDLKELFEHIESNGKRMNAIIDDMLTLAKFEKAPLRIETVDMAKLFRKVWEVLLISTPNQAKLNLADLPHIAADVSMLEQVVVNLLSNAVKYSSKKETPVITVGFDKTNTTITFFVKDNGAGFDMKNYHKLFGAFQRLHGASEFDGTGVGLLLVKKIIEKHGGVVWAEGRVNEGATFYFTLRTD